MGPAVLTPQITPACAVSRLAEFHRVAMHIELCTDFNSVVQSHGQIIWLTKIGISLVESLGSLSSQTKCNTITGLGWMLKTYHPLGNPRAEMSLVASSPSVLRTAPPTSWGSAWIFALPPACWGRCPKIRTFFENAQKWVLSPQRKINYFPISS
jgi:hypothetical protein